MVNQLLQPVNILSDPMVVEIPAPSASEVLRTLQEEREKEYNVEDIFQVCKKRYQVKWDDGSMTWEPKENVKHLLRQTWTFNQNKRRKTKK